MAETRRRFPWGLTLLSALLLCMLVSLGVWQTHRMQWKAELIAAAERLSQLPPAPPEAVFASSEPEFRKVSLVCPGLGSARYVELQSIHQGQAGVRIISPCSVATADGVLLIDRGFVPDSVSARPPVGPSAEPVTVVAEVRRTPAPGPMAIAAKDRRFYARDNSAMAAALGEGPQVVEWTLFALTSSNPDWAALQPSAPPPAFSNNHLGYALTWFGLALALVGFYIALLRRMLKPSIQAGGRSTSEAGENS